MSDPVLELSFQAGLDEATRDELVEPGAGWPELVNLRQDRRGAATKRLGYAALARTRFNITARSAGNRVGCHKDVIWTIDGTHLDAYAETPAYSAIASRVPEASVTTRTLTSVTTNAALYDVALCNGYVATAALRGLAVAVGVETTAGVVVRPSETVVTASVTETAAQLVTYGVYFILLVSDTGGANIAAYYLNTTSDVTVSAGWVSIGNVATDRITLGVEALALAAQSLTNRVAFAYVNNSGGASQVTVKTMTIAGVTETATVNTSSATPNCVALEGSIADTLWVAWNETTGIEVKGLDADSLAVTLATGTAIISANTAPSVGGIHIVSSSTAGQGKLVVNDGDGLNLHIRGFQTTAGATAVYGNQYTIYGATINARPFQYSGQFYGLFRSGDTTNGVSVLCDFTDPSTNLWLRPVAWAFPGLTQAIGLRQLHHIAISATSYAYAMPVRKSAIGDGVELVSYDFADRKRWRSASHNGSLVLAGGVLSYFDGRRVAEVGYLHAPKTPTATDSGGGSGLTGDYRYVATFEEMDDDGNWCVSGVSSPSSVLTIADNVGTITTHPLTITNRLTSGTAEKRVRIAFYRTEDGGEPPYYFLTSAANATGAIVSISDSTPDATLTSNRLLYGTGNLPATNGSSQDRRAPPYCQDVVGANGMLVVASGSELHWSFQTIDGEGAAFNPIFAIPVEGNGNIVALAFQDGTFFAFKRRSIYAVAGEAPADNGSSGGLGTPRRLAVDAGCIDPNSVVVTSAGVFFQSERGIELLTRAGTVVWIGEKVQATLDSYPVVSSAVLDDRNGLVRFSLAAAESGGRVSGEGRDLVFDLALGAWQSVDDKTGANSHEASQDAAMVYIGGSWRYGWIGTDGIVYYERLPSDAAAHLDGSTWATMRAVSPWVAIAGRNGEQFIDQVLLLAKRVTGHDLDISIAFDFSDSYTNTKTFTATQIASLAREWLVREITQTTSQAVRVKLEDATPSSGDVGTGQGATWVALSFNGQPHRGPKRTSAAQRGG